MPAAASSWKHAAPRVAGRAVDPRRIAPHAGNPAGGGGGGRRTQIGDGPS